MCNVFGTLSSKHGMELLFFRCIVWFGACFLGVLEFVLLYYEMYRGNIHYYTCPTMP